MDDMHYRSQAVGSMNGCTDVTAGHRSKRKVCSRGKWFLLSCQQMFPKAAQEGGSVSEQVRLWTRAVPQLPRTPIFKGDAVIRPLGPIRHGRCLMQRFQMCSDCSPTGNSQRFPSAELSGRAAVVAE